MKKIVLSSLMIVGLVGVVTMATRAAFSDSEVLAANTFAAGKLDLALGESETMPFSISDVVPGDKGEGKIRLTNTDGSIPGKLNIEVKNFVQAENTLTEPELNPTYGTHDYENGPTAGELNFFLAFAAYLDVNKNGTFDTGDIQLTYNGQKAAYPGFWSGDFHYHPISSMNDMAWNDIMTLNGGDSVDLVVMWQMPTVSGDSNYDINISQTDGLSFDIDTALEQDL